VTIAGIFATISTTDSGDGASLCIGTPGRWRQGMLKAYRFTLTMPACVTVDVIGRVDPSVSGYQAHHQRGPQISQQSRLIEFAPPSPISLTS
jgi:hypothetical protein